MIPSMSLMIGAYIVLRCLEMILRSESSWGSGAARGFMSIASLLVILLTFWQVAEIIMAGAQFGGLPR